MCTRDTTCEYFGHCVCGGCPCNDVTCSDPDDMHGAALGKTKLGLGKIMFNHSKRFWLASFCPVKRRIAAKMSGDNLMFDKFNYRDYPGNYIQRTYRLRRRHGFPFSCLTFRDRHK